VFHAASPDQSSAFLEGTRRLCTEWNFIDPTFNERDGGDPSLRTSSSIGIIDVTLAEWMDENDVRDNDADDEDNPGDAYGVSLGPRLSDSHQASQACHPPYGLNRCHHPSKPRKCPLFADLSIVGPQAPV